MDSITKEIDEFRVKFFYFFSRVFSFEILKKPKENEENNDEKLKEFNEELKKLKQLYLKKQENRKRMEENLTVDQKLLKDKEEEFSEILGKNKVLMKETVQKKNEKISKTQDLNFLKHQLNKLQESVKLAFLMSFF